MPDRHRILRTTSLLLAGVLSSSTVISQAATQATSGSSTPKPTPAPMRYRPDRFAGRARLYYALVWGVDSLSVKWAESGELIRLSWRVIDPAKAAALHDKKANPLLSDPRAGVQLVVPSLEKVGQLRQSSTPEAGKSYWMAFSNKGRVVKRGDKVDIVIGQFHAIGLLVE